MLKYLGTLKKTPFTNANHKWVVSSEEKPFRRIPSSGERASVLIKKISNRGETPTIYRLVD